MTGIEKILESVKASGDSAAAKVIDTAKKNANAILTEAAKKAQAITEQSQIDAESKAKTILENADSSAKLIVRDALLRAKSETVDLLIDKTVESICNMEDNSYFEILTEMVKNAGISDGTVFLCKKDLDRMPKSYAGKLAGIPVSKDAVDIDGGFIQKSGDIEINMSFAALKREKYDMICDYIVANLR